MSAWSDYKKKRAEELANGAAVRPTDLIDSANYADAKTAEQRYAMCLVCPSLIKTTKQCKECGCFMVLKTKLKQATCPLGKW